MKEKVLLIGWDAADWNVINPLLEAGKMPNLQKLIEKGVMGNLATLYPPLSPMLWTSIATGKRPYKHGIYGFSEPSPDGQSIRPITNFSRKTRALWNMFTTQEMKSNVVGWWPSHPAEPINGVMVSNLYQKQLGRLNRDEGEAAPARRIGGNEVLDKIGTNWPLPPQCIYPERIREPLSTLRLHPQELSGNMLAPFVPEMNRIDQKKDHRVESIAKILCECTSVHAAATATMQLEEWDFMAVYYDSIDHFCHGFMQYHPPKLPWVSEHDFGLYKNVVETGYCYHDMMLGTLMQLAGEETTIMLVSDHGFHPDHNRPKQVADEPAGPAEEHSHYGIFVMAGPGIKRDERIYGADLLDITPTILHAYGLPIGEDMDGKVLLNAFIDDRKPEIIPSWDLIDKPDGSHPAETAMDPLEAKHALDQLVELGYIEKPDENMAKAVADTVRELEYNLARSYVDAGQFAPAAEILQKLYTNEPDHYRFGIQLVNCRLNMGRFEGLEEFLDQLEERKATNTIEARKKLKEQVEQYMNPETGKPDLSEASEKERKAIDRLQKEAQKNPYASHVLRASLHAAKQEHEAAQKQYEAALKKGGGPLVFQAYAETLCQLEKYDEALAAAQQALLINPNDARAYLTQAKVHAARAEFSIAESVVQKSIGLLFHNPDAHYWLGRISRRRKRIPQAVEALRICLKQAPQHIPALELLIEIYTADIPNADEVKQLTFQLQQAQEILSSIRDGRFSPALDEQTVQRALSSDSALEDALSAQPPSTAPLADSTVIVSGFPRSGTSMMMQMLAAAGQPIHTDEQRGADENNPNGYFEFEPAKALRRNNRWMPETTGKTLKVIAQLLWHLPMNLNLNYRIIFMERDLDEILRSQQKMLNKDPAGNLRQTLEQQLRRIKRFIHTWRIPVLYVSYTDCIHDPLTTAQRVSEFMDGQLDCKKMVDAIDPQLYRNRAADSGPGQ